SECTVVVQTAEETFDWQETLAFSMPYFGVKDGGFDQEFYYLQNGFYSVYVRKGTMQFHLEMNKNLTKERSFFHRNSANHMWPN
ncbi:hypothetical protein, partial [Heyndrickxia sporothermodurans]